MLTSLNMLEKGVILTDSNNIVKECNIRAQDLLKTNSLIGRSINTYSDQIVALRGKQEKLSDGSLIIFGGIEDDYGYETVLDQISPAFFTSSLEGSLLFKNEAFSVLLGDTSKSVFELFKESGIKISNFNVIKKSKKDVYYDIKLSKLSYKLHLIPISDKDAKTVKICGYFIKNDAKYDKNSMTESSIVDNKSSKVDSSTFDDKKPYLQLKSKYMATLYSIISNISSKDITILLLGKSGTGKSSIAKRIHENSLRSSKPFVTVNCTSLPANLIESELFGYEKGAFTSASTSGKKGLVEIADGGTLFIDEIGEMPLFLQGKLLELLQEKTYRPIGSTSTKRADVRIIVATNKDLLGLVSQKKFREDLYYRIAVAIINIPPLSERPEDKQLLIDAYVLYFNKKHDITKKLSSDAKSALIEYSWPGNIRELEHTIEFLMIRSDKNTIDITDLPVDITLDKSQELSHDLINKNGRELNMSQTNIISSFSLDSSQDYDSYLSEFESKLINHFYSELKSSYKVADYLQISQTKANKLIRKYCR